MASASTTSAAERNIAMVFQDGALYPHLLVRENLAFPLEVAGPANREEVDARVTEIARGLGIEGKLDRRPAALSGGERQRVAIGRALIRGQPTVLLMDEPLASLDTGLRGMLRAEIGSLVRSLRVTTVYVTHDQVEALSLADRVAVLRRGTVEDVGTPAEVYQDPASAFVAAFLGSPPINLAWATVWVVNGDRVIVDFGTQRLELPWDDAFSEALTPYHGEPVIVGIRPEWLTLSAAGANGSLLHGRISSVEYHGHEWLARLEVGFRPVNLDAVPPPPRRLNPGPATIARRRFRFTADRGPAAAPPEHHGEHRAANLLVRLDSGHGWTAGSQVSVTVDIAHLYVFDKAGKRIGAAAQSFG